MARYGQQRQCMQIREIKGVAFRNRRKMLGVQRGDVGVLTIEVEHIGREVALLQQVTAAGEVAHPGAGLLCPGFIAREPLTEGP